MKKIALVTGATSGIGEACARKLAENGYNMIVTGRRADRLEAVAADLRAVGAEVLTLVFDVRDREAATAAIQGLPSEWQEIDVLINNAGGALGLEPEYEGNYQDWDTMIDTNIKPGLVETNFSVIRFHGDKERADGVYKGIQPLMGKDIAESVYYAVSAPEHVQVAEILILATHQASGSVIVRS